MHKIGGAHLQSVNNHYAKFVYKGMKCVLSYRLRKLGTRKVLRTDRQKEGWTDGVDPLLDLLSLK